MKFGKTIKRAEGASSTFNDKWMCYKDLKKRIKDIVKAANKSNPAESEDSSASGSKKKTPLNASTMEEERIFFREVRIQLGIVDAYFNEVEARLLQEYNTFEAKIPGEMKNLKEDKVKALLAECRQLHMNLIMLENYAVINYCGFAKITKKHDKNTGFETRSKFMTKVVNNLNFASYPHLLEILSKLERIFKSLEGVSVSEKAVSVSQHLSNDERITFLDEVKEEKKMLKGEVTEEMAIERGGKEEKGGRGDMMDVEDAFDVLVRAATTNPTTNEGLTAGSKRSRKPSSIYTDMTEDVKPSVTKRAKK